MMYINGIGSIATEGPEPDYSRWVPPAQLRRMSRIMKMGIGAGRQALEDAGIEKPDAIITASALGCNEDTEKFLASFLEHAEGLGSPTPFIQSTHNAIGGQLALSLGCTGYNTTYSQRQHSLENALQDADLWLQEHKKATVLCGITDEITPLAHTFLEKTGYFRKSAETTDGSYFMSLSTEPGEKYYGKILEIVTAYADEASFREQCEKVFASYGMPSSEITGVGSPEICGALGITEILEGGYFPSCQASPLLKVLGSPGNEGEYFAFIHHAPGAYFSLIFVQKASH